MSTESGKRQVELEIWSDVSCPWCYVGQKKLYKALADPSIANLPYEIITVYKPYRINDSLTSEPQTKKEVYEKKFVTHDFSENVKSRVNVAGEAEGIHFAWDPDATVRDTRPCHRLLEKVFKEQGSEAQSKLACRLYQDYNEKNIDVAETGQLAKIAADLGLMSEEEAQTFLSGDDGAYELEKELAKAPHFGIDSVPFYIFDDGNWHWAGATEPEEYLRAFEQLADRMR